MNCQSFFATAYPPSRGLYQSSMCCGHFVRREPIFLTNLSGVLWAFPKRDRICSPGFRASSRVYKNTRKHVHIDTHTIYIQTYIHSTYVHTCIYPYIHLYILYSCMHTYVHTQTYLSYVCKSNTICNTLHIHTHTNVFVHTYIYIYIHMYIQVWRLHYIYIYMYMYIYIYIYIYTLAVDVYIYIYKGICI